ncbi:MAG: hypothetical protein KIT84_08760 [Labilithrix sp.]|nr:hypothetical protein [Labilithrix sp.]MCW5811089.1 hypothetical protein [Labilithrix sp.]
MIRRTLALALAFAAPPKPAPAPPPPPLTPLAMLPSIARVKVKHHGGRTFSVVHEINLPRGEWKGEALRFHVAFGAPGPRAIDAHLVALADGALEPADDDVGEPLPTERVPRRPSSAHPLLGRETMAGIVVTIKGDSLTKALARGEMASLRIRAVVDATEPDASGATSLVARLGVSRGTPLTLGRIVALSVPRATANLCGPEADTHPLAVGKVPKEPGDAPIAPVLAVRHASDDLCLRLWADQS